MEHAGDLLMSRRGFTLIEIIMAAAIAAVVAGGTMIAFVTALNISRRTSTNSEAAHLAQQTTERFRNRVACDDAWFDPAACAPSTLPAGWQADPVVPPTVPPTTRQYQITRDGALMAPGITGDCDGTAGVGDCVVVQARVTWTPPP